MKYRVFYALKAGLLFIFCISGISYQRLPADTVIVPGSLPNLTDEAIWRFEYARDKTEGLHVFNPVNEDIFYPQAHESFWQGSAYYKPVNGRRMLLVGRLTDFFIENAWGDEYDWNLDIVPTSDFSYIIDRVKPLVTDRGEWKSCTVNGAKRDCLQAEVTPDESLYNNEWFPRKLANFQPSSPVVNKIIGVYGPWVMDSDHDWRPEIHPCEVIWWRERSRNRDVYYIFGVQDDSNRFDTRSDFVFDGDYNPRWRPWCFPPITSVYKIPFEYNGQYRDHLVINIEELKARHIATPSAPNPRDSDDGKNHKLRFAQRRPGQAAAVAPSTVLAEVNENFESGSHVGVRFTEMGKKPNGNIIGYVQLTTAYGRGSNGNEGYQVLRVTVNYPVNRVQQEAGRD